MRTHRYLSPVTIAFLFAGTGCANIRHWEYNGSPDRLPPEVQKRWYDEQRNKDMNRAKEHYQWMQEEKSR